MKGNADRLRLYQEYISYYEDRSRDGNISLCDKQDVEGLRHIVSVCSPSAELRGSHFQIIVENYRRRLGEQQRQGLLKTLLKGFAILELICINLFLYPWRKEIRTLKRFTGNFVYYIEPVIPGHTLKKTLQRVGYTIITETEYIIGRKINTEEAKQVAFELFVARIQCQELIQLINQGKTDCLEPLFTESSCEKDEGGGTECKNAEEPSTDKNMHILLGFSKIEGFDKQEFKCKIKELTTKGLENRVLEESLASPLKPESVHDDSEGYFSKPLDSEEFINKYSDLNLAQKPIFPRHESKTINMKTYEKKTNQWIKPLLEESNKYLLGLESSSVNAMANPKYSDEAGWSKAMEFVQEPVSEARGESSDAMNYSPGWHKSNIEGNFGNMPHNDSRVDYSRSTKHGQPLERSVIKLKMEKINNVFLPYPTEETLPPNSKAPTSDNELTNTESKWKLAVCEDHFSGGSTSNTVNVGLCTPKLTFPMNKAVECSGDIENISHLREPPNSTYIPPGGVERHIGKISDLQPEEDQSLSQSSDIVQIDETIYKMNTDTREDFVIITRRENFQS
ncbi:Hypothetical predicted protein [Pelobates cultripes]|uniref:Spermatogenesis-associated protein 2 PUB-like domain-containing protein n=1 Tax=Pelobates cultripes TaxID=61616 RepID=A0AAD1WQI8_PELCU|nr:Hypothetical predicted protein [Pelobates cultripes]